MNEIDLESHPVQSIFGTLKVPGDKSISHRALILASIAQGVSVVDDFLAGDDCLATLHALQNMGVVIRRPSLQQVIIHGVGKYGLQKPQEVINCGNSGTSIRLLAGLLAGQTFDSELTGDSSLLKRPMLRISQPLAQMGACIETVNGMAPLKISGNKVLSGIEYEVPQASAQVKSCLLLAGLYAQGTTYIKEKTITRNHTELMLKTFSYPINYKNHSAILYSNGECLATDIHVPGDISSAAFFIVAACIIPGSEIVLTHVGVNPTRTGILDILGLMGADITVFNCRQSGAEPVADLKIRYAPLKGVSIGSDLVSLAIDEFPIIFIAAACAQGETRVHGAEELRYKESDRISVMVEGLNTLGIDATGFTDGIRIMGGVIQGGVVDSLGDHRIAMSFAIAGAVASKPITIKNCATIATSFPQFKESANELSLCVKECG